MSPEVNPAPFHSLLWIPIALGGPIPMVTVVGAELAQLLISFLPNTIWKGGLLGQSRAEISVIIRNPDHNV